VLVAATEQRQLDRDALAQRCERPLAAGRHMARDEEHRLHAIASL